MLGLGLIAEELTFAAIRLLSSKPFQFLVGPNGPDRKLFAIHTTEVENLSALLPVMMNSPTHEAIDGVATLEDVNEQTFVGFCEYACMENYTPAQQQLVQASSNFDRGESPTREIYIEGAFAASMKKNDKRDDYAFASLDDLEVSCGKCG